MEKKKSKGELLFDSLKQRYMAAYLAANDRPVEGIFYKKGYVYINDETSKYRAYQIEKMCQNLEKRANEQTK